MFDLAVVRRPAVKIAVSSSASRNRSEIFDSASDLLSRINSNQYNVSVRRLNALVRPSNSALSTSSNLKHQTSNLRFVCHVEPVETSPCLPSRRFLDYARNDSAKKGLCAFSLPTVVSGPWPGQMIVSSGSVRIFSALVCTASE